MTDSVLVLAWLVLAHLLADFVLQNDWIAMNKGTEGRLGWAALAVHGFHVGLCLVPAVLAFGPAGLLYLVVVVASHIAVDRWKVRATRGAERAALEAARKRLAGTGEAPASGLGSAWTPWPGMLFLADQALHLTIAIVGWLVLLEGVALQQWFLDVVNTILRSWDRATVHAVVLTSVVLVCLFLLNTRAAYYFVLALVSPREIPPTPSPDEPAVAEPQPAPAVPAASQAGYTVRVGPLVATVEPGVARSATSDAGVTASHETASHEPAEVGGVAVAAAPGAAPSVASSGNGTHVAGTGVPAVKVAAVPVGARPSAAVPSGAPARIGATIGALERLLTVAFVLVGAEAAVGLVIAAKTIARFKQLDDRGFAEYYLLGTLASVSVAIGTAIVAKAALGTIP